MRFFSREHACRSETRYCRDLNAVADISSYNVWKAQFRTHSQVMDGVLGERQAAARKGRLNLYREWLDWDMMSVERKEADRLWRSRPGLIFHTSSFQFSSIVRYILKHHGFYTMRCTWYIAFLRLICTISNNPRITGGKALKKRSPWSPRAHALKALSPNSLRISHNNASHIPRLKHCQYLLSLYVHHFCFSPIIILSLAMRTQTHPAWTGSIIQSNRYQCIRYEKERVKGFSCLYLAHRLHGLLRITTILRSSDTISSQSSSFWWSVLVWLCRYDCTVDTGFWDVSHGTTTWSFLLL